jgi:type II secretory pathway component PulM
MASPLASLRAPAALARWWSTKSRGERTLAGGLAIVAIATVAWWALWQPLARDISALRVANARDAVALGEARRMTDEIAGLARAAAPAAPADPRADFRRIVASRACAVRSRSRSGRTGARRRVRRGRLRRAIATLEALQRDARMRVVDAMIAARVEPGTVRAELVLAR